MIKKNIKNFDFFQDMEMYDVIVNKQDMLVGSCLSFQHIVPYYNIYFDHILIIFL